MLTFVGFVSFWYFGKKPYKHRGLSQENLTEYFEALFARGFNGGNLIIEVPDGPLFIQFSKYIVKKGEVGLQFDFPSMPWSEKYYELLKRELTKKGLRFL